MLGQMDWDAYWRFERFRRRCDPLDFRKWKSDSQRALKGLYPGAPRLLDSTAGLGDHTVNLAEAGFRVEACDRSPVAREATREALAEAGLDVPVFDAEWAALDRPGRYDLIFNDALHWIEDPDALRAALRGFFDALTPGGALVFFFADAAKPQAGYGLELMEWDWAHMEHERVAWEHTLGERTVTLSVLAERHATTIDEHHVYLDREGDAPPRASALTMTRIYRWDWHGIAPLLAELGYVELRSDHFENTAKGYTFAMSRAFKPAA